MESFPILGRSLSFRVRTPELKAWLHAQWDFPEHVLPLVPYEIHLEERDAPPERLRGAPVAVPLHGGTLAGLVSGETWRFGSLSAGVQLRLEARQSRIVVWGLEQAQHAAATFVALYLCMGESLRASGLLPLHAAIAVRDGRATALAGASGTGKSTTLWRALRAGCSPLAEDLAWLDPSTLAAHGWDRGLRLCPDARERFAPEVPLERFRTDPDGKLFLPYAQLARPRLPAATLVRLALLEREDAGDGGTLADRGGPAPLVRLAPRDAVRAWWEAIGVPLSPAVQRRVAVEVSRLLERVEAVRLRLGSRALPRDL